MLGVISYLRVSKDIADWLKETKIANTIFTLKDSIAVQHRIISYKVSVNEFAYIITLLELNLPTQLLLSMSVNLYVSNDTVYWRNV